jgi:hypothetical protein
VTATDERQGLDVGDLRAQLIEAIDPGVSSAWCNRERAA